MTRSKTRTALAFALLLLVLPAAGSVLLPGALASGAPCWWFTGGSPAPQAGILGPGQQVWVGLAGSRNDNFNFDVRTQGLANFGLDGGYTTWTWWSGETAWSWGWVKNYWSNHYWTNPSPYDSLCFVLKNETNPPEPVAYEFTITRLSG